MRGATIVIAIVIVGARVAPALAEPVDPRQTPSSDPPAALPGEREAASSFATAIAYERRTRWQSELAVFFGDAPIDHVQASTSPGYSLASGIHRDRLTVLGEYTLAAVRYHAPSTTVAGQGDIIYADTTGLLHRVGGVARYSVVKLASGAGIARWFGELWLEGGAGMQIARWDRGGTFVRPDVAFGIGVQGARRAASNSRGGLFVALRVHLGRRTDIDGAPATCSAPCTMPSPPAAWTDRSALLHVGFLFGN
jgi:hypothetical protein